MQSNNSNGYAKQSDLNNLSRRFDQLVTSMEDFMLQISNRVHTPPRVESKDAQLPEPNQEAEERSAFEEEAKKEPKRR
jgi:hypothetical protein